MVLHLPLQYTLINTMFYDIFDVCNYRVHGWGNLFSVNVMLSVDETYADIMPVRVNNSSPSAFM